MKTPFLFHGPEARSFAVESSIREGRPVSEPIGDNGLKVADSRLVVETALNPGVGSKPPTLVIGPLDLATPEAGDALLKTLEEVDGKPLRIFLWADHLSGVIPTIQSRTRLQWCPPIPGSPNPLWEWEAPARAVADGVLRGDPLKMLGPIREAGKDWPLLAESLLRELAKDLSCQTLSGEERLRTLQAWGGLRPLLQKSYHEKVSLLSLADSLLPEEA
jgi:hypothetical protein